MKLQTKILKVSFVLILLLISLILIPQENTSSKIMYVNSREGLEKYLNPSMNSIRIGVLSHGERIDVYERSATTDTINGITEYWYKTQGDHFNNRFYNYSWVFGGYLSAELPLDVPAILGLWDEDIGMWCYFFRPDYSFTMAINEKRDGRRGFWGTWMLNGNTLTLFWGSKIPIDQGNVVNIQITIIDRNKIIFDWPNTGRVILTRSNDMWLN